MTDISEEYRKMIDAALDRAKIVIAPILDESAGEFTRATLARLKGISGTAAKVVIDKCILKGVFEEIGPRRNASGGKFQPAYRVKPTS